ncbi:MAG: PIG-L family deacetylase [Actinobacteria bacterium]|nr:PIG-L family deacetylase [Actinomycetota bacterium]
MRILAIGAHPDDIELLCAGTLVLYHQKGHEVYICHVCDGNKGSMIYNSKELAKIRRNEAINSAKLIGANSIWAGISDGEVVLDLGSREKIIDVIRQANPDLIITHSPDDYHSDHVNVSRLVFEATYLANLKLWKTNYPSSDRLPYLYYMDTLAGVNFIPSEYVNISDTIETKIKMMMEMKSQLGWLKDMHNCDAPEFIKSVAKFRGFQAGVLYAEAFTQQKLYPQGLTKRILP